MQIKEEGSIIFTALNGEETIGAVKIKLTQAGYGYISNMFVTPKQRRKGVATYLMKAVLARYGNIRLELIVSSYPENVMGVQKLAEFYSKFGFVYGPTLNTRRKPRESDKRRMFRNPDSQADTNKEEICACSHTIHRIPFRKRNIFGMVRR